MQRIISVAMLTKAGLIASMLGVGALASAQTPLQVGAGEGQVSIIAWPGYIERGESDKAYDWVTPFEKNTGCKVVVKTAATSDEMVALMGQDGYDLVTASGDASLRLIHDKKVREISIELIPSYRAIDPRFQQTSWHTVGGKYYGVPFQWGPNVLMYNTKIFPVAPTSWSVVFEPMTLPDGKPNQGRVQAYDAAIYIADAALYLKQKRPDLRINDPYELNEAQYKAVLDLLRKQRPLVARYWHDATVQVEDFTKAGAAASSSWPFQVNTLKGNKQPIASVIPNEGATGWADTTMMHINAKHPKCAYKWLEWSLNPKLQGDLAAWFGSVPVVSVACINNKLLGKDGCRNNGIAKLAGINFWKTPQTQCTTQKACVPYERWVADYSAIMNGR